MAENRVENDNNFEEFLGILKDKLSDDDLPDGTVERVQLKEPDLSIDDEIIKIFEQRREQRADLLKFLKKLTWAIIGFFVVLTTVKVFFKMNTGTEVVSDALLGTIAVSLFTEVIVVVRGITKALWDDKNILWSPVVSKMKK